MFEQITIPPYDEKPNNLGVYKDNPTNKPDTAFHSVEVDLQQTGSLYSLIYECWKYHAKLNFLDVKYFTHLDRTGINALKQNLAIKSRQFQIIDFFGFNLGLTEIKGFQLTDEFKDLLLLRDLDSEIYQHNRHFEFYTADSGLYFIICRDLKIEKILKT